MQNQWYRKTEAEVCTFFDVNPEKGLSKNDVLHRLARFGNNKDVRLAEPLLRVLKTTVIRDGKKNTISLNQLVPGDVVLLHEGCRVPADIRLLRVEKLHVNQSRLTGEVLPVAKNTFPLANKAPISKQKNMAFSGSYVESGTGIGIVVGRGDKTEIASNKIPRYKLGIKGNVIARRLKRFGVIVLRKKSLGIYRKIDTVVITADLSESEIIEIIRKVQLSRNIDCKFAVSKTCAEKLSKEFAASTYDARTKSGDIMQAQFIVNLETNNSLELALGLQKKGRICLWVSDGKERTRAFNAVPISLVVGERGRDDVILAADIFAPRDSSTILTRILYNKK